MIVELANTISPQDRNINSLTYQNTLFPAPATKQKYQSLKKRKNWPITDVFREPIEGIPEPRTLSILEMCYRERTTLQTQGAVICMRYCGSSTGQALTANFVLFAPTRRLPESQ